MTRFSARLLLAPLTLAACGGSERPAPADSAAPAAPAAAAPAAREAWVTVVYHVPKDTGAFEKYYRETHLPLVSRHQQAIGFTRAELTRFDRAADGGAPRYYRQAKLYFPSVEARSRGLATPGFQEVSGDLSKFASGGLTALLAEQTNDASAPGASPASLVTVLYQSPKDTAAFEKYYAETHLPIVSAGQSEIGFSRAELSRFTANADGSMPPALYRQAVLYFESPEALEKGLASAAFKRVADDLGNFATGGLAALVGRETR